MVDNKKKYMNQLMKIIKAFKSRNEQLSEELQKNNEEIRKMEEELRELRVSTSE